MAEVPLGISGVVIALPSLIQACIAFIDSLKELWQRYKTASKLVSRLDFGFQLHLSNTEDALSFVHELGLSLKPEAARQLVDIIAILQNDILARAVRKLEPYKTGSWSKRLSLASTQNSVFASVENDLERWVEMFKNRLYFLALVPKNILSIDQYGESRRALRARTRVEAICELVLRGQLVRNPDVLIPVDERPSDISPRLRFSDIYFNENSQTLFQTKYPPPLPDANAPSSHSTRTQPQSRLLNQHDASALASILNASEPDTTAILKCRGYYPVGISNPATAHKLAFECPEGLGNPRTLRDLLVSDRENDPRHSLNDRMRLARRIASSLLFVHLAGLVHKNLRPENVVVFERVGCERDEAFPKAIGYPYLVGFDYARCDGVPSTRVSDSLWWKDLYRHPQRQGRYPDRMYSMLHDVYSLGVLLLEIALWSPLVLDGSHISDGPDKDQIIDPQPNSQNADICNITTSDGVGGRRLRLAEDIRQTFLRAARRELPRSMGKKYSEVVLSCLCCIDEADEAPVQGSDVGAVYVSSILGALEEIVV